ncbi:MAG: hypothetical protein JWM82_2164 [Myxococcales bacterium]|nr:hypothetical protein [Myxococcales bacterium]
MPLYRHTKLPPPPELGDKTLWQYLPRQSVRRVFFLLLALGAVLVIRATGGFSKFGTLFDAIGSSPAEPRPGAAPVYHLKVTRPEGTPAAAPP